MKKRFLIAFIPTIIIVLTVSLLTQGIQQLQQNNNIPNLRGNPLNIIINASFPSLTENLAVCYTVVPDEFNFSRFQIIANEFGLSGEIEFINSTPTSGTYYVLKDDNKTLRYHLSTGVWRYISNEAYPEVYQQPNLPSDEEGLNITQDFLQNNGFWSQNITFSNIAYNYQRKCNKSTDEVIEEFILTKTYYFDTTLNGITLGGIGSKYTVTIGDNETIVAFAIPTRTFTVKKTDSLLSTSEILGNLQTGTNIRSISRTRYDNRTVIITHISLCYFVKSLIEDPDDIFLCCRFKGHFADTPEEGFSVYINAVEIQ